MRARHLAFLSFSVFASSAVLASGALLACSSDSSGTTTNAEGGTGTDGGGGTETSTPGANEAKQTGRIVGALDKLEIPNVTVTVAGKSAVTKPDGTYELVVPKDTPYVMSVTGDEYFKLNEQEWIFKGTTLARGDTSLLSKDTANLLSSFLPPRDKAKGLLVVKVQPIAPCDDEGGSTIAIEPKGTSKLTYFAGGRPNQSATSAEKGASFSAAFTDVDVGVNIKVTVTSPKCSVVAYPFEQSDVTYTGNAKTEAGDVLSYYRVFIRDPK